LACVTLPEQQMKVIRTRSFQANQVFTSKGRDV